MKLVSVWPPGAADVPAVVTVADLHKFMTAAGAHIIQVTEKPGWVTVSYWPKPTVAEILRFQTGGHFGAHGVGFTFRLRTRWWAAWRIWLNAWDILRGKVA